MNTERNKFISQHLSQINWILVDLSHPGNLGASARALKVMGASNMILVNPKIADSCSDQDAIKRAVKASDLLKNCRQMSFEKAIERSHHVIAFTSRRREIEPPEVDFIEMIKKIVDSLVISNDSRVSMVFGGERVGLMNKDVIRCTNVCKIDSGLEYSSINLSHAVQIVAYALRSQLNNTFIATQKENNSTDHFKYRESNLKSSKISQKKIYELKTLFLQISGEIGLYGPEKKGKLEERISRILATSDLSKDDYSLLKSFFALINKKLK
ncbi:MAG: hypothetical protein CBD16_00880 [Betaproteobacteria bacterium TMED156]|nr:MAG: hypothetical protein CBD16_00880 [Betaproteobacteria bacterium TMED156]